jgi:hypothetical protein
VSENELDAQEIAAYRKVLDFARAVVDGKVPPRRAIQAGDALFAALARRDDEVARLRVENTTMKDLLRTLEVATAVYRIGRGVELRKLLAQEVSR